MRIVISYLLPIYYFGTEQNESHMQLKPNKGIGLVYTLLLFFGVVLLLISVILEIFPPFDKVSSSGIILNLSTEIIGVAIIFFFINRYLKSQEEEVLEQIANLRQEVRGNIITWDSRKGDEALFDVKVHLRTSERISIVGQNMIGLLEYLFEDLPNAVDNGLKVRLLTLDENEDNPVLEMLANAQRDKGVQVKDIVAATIKSFKMVHDIRAAITPENRKHFEHRVLKTCPYCSIVIIEGKNKSFGKAKIVYYSPSEFRPKPGPGKRLRIIVDNVTDRSIFNYYEDNFNWLWEGLSEKAKD